MFCVATRTEGEEAFSQSVSQSLIHVSLPAVTVPQILKDYGPKCDGGWLNAATYWDEEATNVVAYVCTVS